MWKKDESEEQKGAAASAEGKQEAQRPRTPGTRQAAAASGTATIGPSISVTGDVTGDEDLLIQGRVDGLVDLQRQSVTVGKEGRVKADITGQIVTVEGHVEGDLTAAEQVILRSEARVQGDITAPRVVLEDGASFKGLVDMSKPSTEAEKENPGVSGSSSGRKASSGNSGTSSASGSGSSSSAKASTDGASSSGSGSGKKSDGSSKSDTSSKKKTEKASS